MHDDYEARQIYLLYIFDSFFCWLNIHRIYNIVFLSCQRRSCLNFQLFLNFSLTSLSYGDFKENYNNHCLSLYVKNNLIQKFYIRKWERKKIKNLIGEFIKSSRFYTWLPPMSIVRIFFLLVYSQELWSISCAQSVQMYTFCAYKRGYNSALLASTKLRMILTMVSKGSNISEYW